MSIMNKDIFEKICMYLDHKSLIFYICTSKQNLEFSKNEVFWIQYCNTYWGCDFWEIAKLRPFSSAKHYISMYHEFQRLAKFENCINNKEVLTFDYYKSMWNTLDKKTIC